MQWSVRPGICWPLVPAGLGVGPGGMAGGATLAWYAEVCSGECSTLRFARSESWAASTAVRSSAKWSRAVLPGKFWTWISRARSVGGWLLLSPLMATMQWSMAFSCANVVAWSRSGMMRS